MSEAVQDFASKYTRANWIAPRLLEGYFSCLSELTGPLAVRSVLEVGCGEGFSTRRLRAMLPASVSLRAGDLDDRLVAAAARANPDVPVRRESVYQLPHAGGAFDLVFCLEVLEHMDDPAAALSELCRVCRRYLVLSVPREPLWRVLNMARLKYLSRLGATPGHIQSWSRGGFVRWAGRSCRVLDVRNPVPFTIVLAEANHPKDRP